MKFGTSLRAGFVLAVGAVGAEQFFEAETRKTECVIVESAHVFNGDPVGIHGARVIVRTNKGTFERPEHSVTSGPSMEEVLRNAKPGTAHEYQTVGSNTLIKDKAVKFCTP